MEKKDILDRKPFVDKVVLLIKNMLKNTKGGSFAIDGAWGTGKTFVLKMIREELKKEVKNGLSEYFVFNYNSWEYDYYNEPAIAIVSQLLLQTIDKENEIIDNTFQCARNEIEKIIDNYFENKIGMRVIEDLKAINKKSASKEQIVAFDEDFFFMEAIVQVRKKLAEIADNKPIIIFVDELDRCQPDYAVKVLERLHHLFNGQKNVVLIISVDGSQLDRTIEKIYGKDTDTERFLKKFIDFKIGLDTGVLQKTIEEKYDSFFQYIKYNNDSERNELITTIQKLFDYAKVDIRNQEKIIEKITLINSILFEKNLRPELVLYEMVILISRFSATQKKDEYGKYRYYDDLDWIIKINQSNVLYIETYIPTTFLNYLKSLYTQTINKNEWSGKCQLIKKGLIGHTIFVIDQIHSKKPTLALSNGNIPDGLIEECKSFYTYANLLS